MTYWKIDEEVPEETRSEPIHTPDHGRKYFPRWAEKKRYENSPEIQPRSRTYGRPPAGIPKYTGNCTYQDRTKEEEEAACAKLPCQQTHKLAAPCVNNCSEANEEKTALFVQPRILKEEEKSRINQEKQHEQLDDIFDHCKTDKEESMQQHDLKEMLRLELKCFEKKEPIELKIKECEKNHLEEDINPFQNKVDFSSVRERQEKAKIKSEEILENLPLSTPPSTPVKGVPRFGCSINSASLGEEFQEKLWIWIQESRDLEINTTDEENRIELIIKTPRNKKYIIEVDRVSETNSNQKEKMIARGKESVTGEEPEIYSESNEERTVEIRSLLGGVICGQKISMGEAKDKRAKELKGQLEVMTMEHQKNKMSQERSTQLQEKFLIQRATLLEISGNQFRSDKLTLKPKTEPTQRVGIKEPLSVKYSSPEIYLPSIPSSVKTEDN
ncbi:hypothetical protein PPACK8108_LOCUS12374 [Phakopsora pachyrhizi]|uniref:Uncharacterized protein n=1 Tax=Phakopsora pachyrhizi TaxID=170000 RepID=A0AAV0B1Q0_PHAPC|nr:hypothetical protein PPACK8108_LOCUS12374 [Phakopsora pachyrhizi]